MNHRFRSIMSSAVAIVLALSSVFVCAPVAEAAGAAGHCKPAATVKPAGGQCHQNTVMDCCATSAPQPAVPHEAQQPGTGTVAPPSHVQLDALAVLAALRMPALAGLLRGAPLHGYRSTDLPTLHAAFLI